MVRVELGSGRRADYGGAGTILEAFKQGTEPGSGYSPRGDPERFQAAQSDGNDDGNGPARSTSSSSGQGGFDTGLY